jgi:DNA-binding response OmpR family regulator
VDIILKSESGLEICKYIREFDIHTPVLIITGKTELLTKLRAFECGADDYLCKPFDLLELKARVKALLKRTSNGHPNDVLKVADLEVHTSKRMAMRKGKQLSLRRKEFDILEYLARNAGLLISREQIIQNIWEDTTDIHSNSVDVHVKNLRQQMDKPFKRKLLKTVYGLGYKLEDVV